MGRIFNGIFPGVQLFVMFLFLFFREYSKNILHVRPHPKTARFMKEKTGNWTSTNFGLSLNQFRIELLFANKFNVLGDHLLQSNIFHHAFFLKVKK